MGSNFGRHAWFFALISLCLMAVFSSTAHQLASSSAEQIPSARIIVIYYSLSGNTEKMAAGVVEGVKTVAGVEAILKKVEEVTKEDFISADGIVIGSPTYYANMATPVKQLIDDWYFQNITLFDKVGGAFATGGGRTAGRELVVNAILMAMLNNGMIVVGPLYDNWGTFGASAITAPPDEGVNNFELDDAKRLGKRVAEVALKIKKGS